MRISSVALTTFLCLVFSLNIYGVTYDAIVASDGSGKYKTIQAALDAAPSNSSKRWVIFIKSGTYKEMINVASGKNKITLIGDCNVKVTFDRAINDIDPSTGKVYTVKNSATAYVYGSEFYANNITFENTAGPTAGQALAIYIRADKAVFVKCRFIGNQDTFYGHFVRMYLYNCYIEGTVDFIYGESTMWFESCQLHAKGSCITAANTEPFAEFGMVFNKCTITGTKTKNALLGRTWGPYAATAFLNCSMGDIIKPEGWSDFGDSKNRATARYAEYNNTGSSASTQNRVSWSKVLSSSEASKYTLLNVMKKTYAASPTVDNWNPQLVVDLYPLDPCNTSTDKKTLSISVAQGEGNVTPQSGNYNEGESVTVTATPAPGWLFDRWGGDLSGNTNPATVTMTGNKTISSYFVQDTRNRYTITTLAAPGGSITQTPEGSSLVEGTNVTITAAPVKGWSFSRWTGDHTGTNVTFSIPSLSGNVSVSAAFLPVDKFTYQAENGVMQDAVLETKNAGFTGESYVNISAVNGSFIQIPVYVDEAGLRPVLITFANGSGAARQFSVSINGIQQIASVNFEPTANWTTWESKPISLTLPQGASIITLATINGQDGPNIDKLTIDQAVTAVTPQGKEGCSFTFYDSSLKSLLVQLPVSKNLKLSVFSLSGKKILSKTLLINAGTKKVRIPLIGLNHGMYLIKFEYNGKLKTEYIYLL